MEWRLLERSIRHSLCFGVYHGGAQVGFGRVMEIHRPDVYEGTGSSREGRP